MSDLGASGASLAPSDLTVLGIYGHFLSYVLLVIHDIPQSPASRLDPARIEQAVHHLGDAIHSLWENSCSL